MLISLHGAANFFKLQKIENTAWFSVVYKTCLDICCPFKYCITFKIRFLKALVWYPKKADNTIISKMTPF